MPAGMCPSLQVIDGIPSRSGGHVEGEGVRVGKDHVPGGLVLYVGIKGDGAAGKVVNGEVVGGGGRRLNAVFLGQGGLEGIIGLLQGVPVGDDGEIDTDLPDRIAAGRGYLAPVVPCETAGVSTVARIPESCLHQFRPEG